MFESSHPVSVARVPNGDGMEGYSNGIRAPVTCRFQIGGSVWEQTWPRRDPLPQRVLDVETDEPHLLIGDLNRRLSGVWTGMMKKFVASRLNRHGFTLPGLLAFIQPEIFRGHAEGAWYVRAMNQIVLLALVVLGTVAGCSDLMDRSTDAKPRFETSSRLLNANLGNLTVADIEGRALAGARIQIGPRAAAPFASNILTTGSDGLVALPLEWKSADVVTVEAPGYIRATYFNRQPEAQVFKLRKSVDKVSPRLEGKTTGFGQLTGNGVLDVSLVYPAVQRAAVSTLELTQLIGTGVDKVKVYGEEIELPSNLSVPAQTETYFMIVPVSLDKPTYRATVPAMGDYRFAAVHAQFDFKKTIDDLRDGKSFFDLINRLQFRSYTTRDFAIRLPAQGANLPLGETALKASVAVQAKGLPRGYAMVATSLVEDGGLCVVTDVKRLLEGEKRTLMASAKSGASLLVLRTLKKYDAKRTDFSGSDYEEMSAIVSSASQSPIASFIPILAPIVSKGRAITFTPPTLSPELKAGLTVVSLSKVEVIGSGGLWLIKKEPVWDLYQDGFTAEMALPSVGADPWATKGRYRWELTYAATAQPIKAEVNPAGIGTMTHVSKTAVDFVVK